MKIYLSEFSISSNLERENNYDEVVDLILYVGKRSGFEIYRSAEYDGYGTIENRIRNSNLLIALIDEYWKSSTWKLHELFYAAGATDAIGTINLPAEEVATLVYVFEDVKAPWLSGLNNTVIIMNNIVNLKEHLNELSKC